MNSRLEQYVEEVNSRLKSLPAEERAREIAEVRQHLESLIAARTEGDETEEAATLAAIQQFGEATDIGQQLTQTRRRHVPQGLIHVFYGLGALAVVDLFLRYVDGPLTEKLLPAYAFSLRFPHHPGVAHSMPEVWLGLAAIAVLFLKDGVRGTIRRFLSRETTAGSAALWLLLYRLMNWHAMGIFAPPSSQILWILSTLILPCALAGFLVSRVSTSPRNGVKGALLGAAILWIPNILGFLTTIVRNPLTLQQNPTNLSVIACYLFFWIIADMAITFVGARMGRRKTARITA